jgi:hypothetical protein
MTSGGRAAADRLTRRYKELDRVDGHVLVEFGAHGSASGRQTENARTCCRLSKGSAEPAAPSSPPPS